jgi:hypothetical protein
MGVDTTRENTMKEKDQIYTYLCPVKWGGIV